jgi:large subunit ribosomal protein L34
MKTTKGRDILRRRRAIGRKRLLPKGVEIHFKRHTRQHTPQGTPQAYPTH